MTACLISVLLTGAPSDPAKAEEARVVAERGRAASEKGEFAEAAAFFRQAHQIDPRPVYLFWIAHLLESNEQWEEALVVYRRYLANDQADKRRELALKKVAMLSKRLERERPEVVLVSEPPGAQVWIDGEEGKPSGTTPWKGRLGVGAHTLLIRKAGYRDLREGVAVAEGVPVSKRVELQPAGVVAAPAPVEPTPDVKETVELAPEPTDWRAVGGWSAIGVGSTALVGGAVFAAAWAQSEDDITSLEERAVSQMDVRLKELTEKEDEADRNAVLTQVMFGVGIVAIASGVALLLTDGDAESAFAPAPGGIAVRF